MSHVPDRSTAEQFVAAVAPVFAAMNRPLDLTTPASAEDTLTDLASAIRADAANKENDA